MIKGYKRLPCSDPMRFLVRFTKQYRNGHIQLYDASVPYNYRQNPISVKIKHSFLGERAIPKIEKEIIDFMNSWNFYLKEYWEMTEEEYDYYYYPCEG